MNKIKMSSSRWIVLVFFFIMFFPFSLFILIFWLFIYLSIKKSWFKWLEKKTLSEINRILKTKYTSIFQLSKDEIKTLWEYYKANKWKLPQSIESLESPEDLKQKYKSDYSWKSKIKKTTDIKTPTNTTSKEKSIWDDYESVLDKF